MECAVNPNVKKTDISIVLAGEAGQGIQSIESILTSLVKKSGYHVFATQEFMSRVRGGTNSTEIRISSDHVAAFVDRIDILIPLSRAGIPHLEKRISATTIIIGDKSVLEDDRVIDVPLAKLGTEVGGAIYVNTIAAGIIAALLSISEAECAEYISAYYASKGDDIKNKNIQAMKIGYDNGKRIASSVVFTLEKKASSGGSIMLSGADAVALGALAGGCDYVCGYPMSPSTSVLEKMAKYSQRHDVIVEQVEDEVGVVNMALGGWYAGARAFVTTSGGGFALMCEGISLAGMIESPLVLHLAQRPGPATGLPTRTEQGDLNLVLYAGHGDFPRIILAPGTLEEGFSLTQTAFNLAARFQVPVFILTDQYYVDSYYDTPQFEVSGLSIEKNIIETTADYKRYAYTQNGISPRGVPGNGRGIVCLDSDEHSEGGYIIEDAETRVKMTDKRLKKNESILAEMIPPVVGGNVSAKKIIVSWGSTYQIIKEALSVTGRDDIKHLHFSWLHPLPKTVKEYFVNASDVVAVENNVTGQFADYLHAAAGIDIIKRILKYDGHSFSVEELAEKITKSI
jgi:2-oxoglutarate/2-oxoacid ferredoxin oxidoreductase subunit alpha